MKIIMGVLLSWAVVFSVQSQITITKNAPVGPNPLNSLDTSLPQSPTIPDPVRMIGGQVVNVDGSWKAITGTVEQVMPGEGIRMTGSIEGQVQAQDFYVTNFPYVVAQGDVIPPSGYVYLVKPAGVYSYTSMGYGVRTIHLYDYGTPYKAPPLTDIQIAVQKAELNTKKVTGEANALKANEEAAEQNDAYGLLRMGERYRDGDGVETNLIKARIYFERAEEAGSDTASNELAHLVVPGK